ncbi:polyprenyl synthetase family protein [Luteipulveratus flavus]|uniref:Polyprenyl synthetase family protein n=1 Tax=Luteipulveratus flavus TaxID=3031728 RepID=A0ABT6CAL7_9MICO|nr:polyprenyl synthetase family protein [Luteipulveratus sp. YIM 133296]MDF8265806.1 polyprenyl synthetase family protein [Luteipulveratus sp. YIM 133296]
MASPLDVDSLRSRVQAAIDTQLKSQQEVLAPVGPATDILMAAATDLLSGGKRLRAAFFYWGYRALGGVDSDELVRAAAAMEMFQAAALIHDDVMDDSDTRRGAPAVHRRIEVLHRDSGWQGDSARFGAAGAVLTGDLCLTWTDEMYATSGLPEPELARGRALFDAMRTQLMGGQFLDVLEAALGWEGSSTDERVARARHVARVKSARYTVEQPLLIGALCAGADEATAGHLSAYGLALGEAFQLRDDLLGVYGDPQQTGKPAGDDLREGKRTVLIAYALDRLAAAQTERFESVFGRPDLDEAEVATVRETISDTGAVEQVEDLITALARSAQDALAQATSLEPAAREALEELIGISTARSS